MRVKAGMRVMSRLPVTAVLVACGLFMIGCGGLRPRAPVPDQHLV